MGTRGATVEQWIAVLVGAALIGPFTRGAHFKSWNVAARTGEIRDCLAP